MHEEVSELADEQDSGSCERLARVGSSPFSRITEALEKSRAFFESSELLALAINEC